MEQPQTVQLPLDGQRGMDAFEQRMLGLPRLRSARCYLSPRFCGASLAGPIRSKMIATAAISSAMQTTIGTA